MKKFFLLFAAVAALSLASCGGGDASSTPDGNSQATSVDPNDPNQQPPQTDNNAADQSVSDGQSQDATMDPNDPNHQPPQGTDNQQTTNPEATNVDPNA